MRELAEFINGFRLFVVEADKTNNTHPMPPTKRKLRQEKLVEQLSSDDFATRQSASIRLILIGETVRPFVEPLTE